MNLHEPPHLKKWPFLLGDAVLLTTAWLVASYHPHPLEPIPLIIIATCVVIGCLLSPVPFIVDYTSKQEKYALALRESIDAQFKKLLVAADSLGHATAQLKTLEETATKALHAAEKLPYRLQDKIVEFTDQLAAAEDEHKIQLTSELSTLRSAETERLEQLVGKIQKTCAEWTALEAATRQQLDALLTKAAASPVARPQDEPRRSSTSEGGPAAADLVTVPAEEPAPVAATEVSSATPEAPASTAEPRKKRAPRKPKLEEAPAAAAIEFQAAASTPIEEPLIELLTEPAKEETPPVDEMPQPAAEEPSAPAVTASTDGRTTLLVTAYIGIGNKLFIRGEGGGLSLEKGVPLSFVSIGKWSWAAPDDSGPIACELFKNDKEPAKIGALILSPGEQTEVSAEF